jgi:hypothetical protein
VQASVPRHRPRRSRYDCGGCQPSGSTSVYLQSDRPRRSCCSRRSRYDCGGVRDILRLRIRIGSLYVYIYSPMRLNNTSIIFRHISLYRYTNARKPDHMVVDREGTIGLLFKSRCH